MTLPFGRKRSAFANHRYPKGEGKRRDKPVSCVRCGVTKSFQRSRWAVWVWRAAGTDEWTPVMPSCVEKTPRAKRRRTRQSSPK